MKAKKLTRKQAKERFDREVADILESFNEGIGSAVYEIDSAFSSLESSLKYAAERLRHRRLDKPPKPCVKDAADILKKVFASALENSDDMAPLWEKLRTTK